MSVMVVTPRRTEVLRAVQEGHATIAAVARQTRRSVADTDQMIRGMVNAQMLTATVPEGGTLPDDVQLALTSGGRLALGIDGPEGALMAASLLGGLLSPPAAPPNPDLLVSDADRDAATKVVAQAYADNRIGQADMERRSGLALAAHTRRDLDVALDDLPVPTPPTRPSPLEYLAQARQVSTVVSNVVGVVVALAVLGMFALFFLRFPG